MGPGPQQTREVLGLCSVGPWLPEEADLEVWPVGAARPARRGRAAFPGPTPLPPAQVWPPAGWVWGRQLPLELGCFLGTNLIVLEVLVSDPNPWISSRSRAGHPLHGGRVQTQHRKRASDAGDTPRGPSLPRFCWQSSPTLMGSHATSQTPKTNRTSLDIPSLQKIGYPALCLCLQIAECTARFP